MFLCPELLVLRGIVQQDRTNAARARRVRKVGRERRAGGEGHQTSFTALLLALLMCVTLIPTIAMADSEALIKQGTFNDFFDRVSGEYLRTDLDNGTSHVTVSRTSAPKEFTQIPDTFID